MLRIQELRAAAGLTQRALAEKIGVKNYTVANWEQGRTEPSIKDLTDLANFFKCSVDYILGRENDFGQVVIFNSENKEHGEFLALFESLSPERKQMILTLIKSLKI